MKNYFTSIFLIGISISSFAQNTWVQKNNFSGNARSRGICFTINGYAYYGTGNHNGGSIETSDFWRYDPTSDTWLQRANLPNGIQAASGSATSGYGYVGIGWWSGNARPNYFKYNPTTNSWTSVANYIGNLTNDGVSIGLNGVIYSGLGGQPYSNNCWEDWKAYNETNDTWTSMASLPAQGRRNACTFVINDEIYVGGGHEGSTILNDFYKYNVTSNSWTSIANCPSTSPSATRNASFVLNGKAYLALPDGLWEYNPSTNSWTSYPMPFSTGVDAAFTLNGKGYVIKYNSKEVWEWSPCVSINGVDVVTACNSYTWIDGNTYTSSNNTATHTLTNVNGCDSIVTLNLTINNTNSEVDVVTACDSYTWIDGNTYTSSNNTATHTLTNVNGCDSLVTLDLTINHSTSSTLYETAIDSYTLNGQTYTQSGTYTQTLTNSQGCDSTITLHLVMQYTGIEEKTLNSFKLFPNPTNSSITVLSGSNEELIITDLLGNIVLIESKNEETTVINLERLTSGTYFIRQGNLIVKFIKQ